MNNNIVNIKPNNASLFHKFEIYEISISVAIPVVQFQGIPIGTSSSSQQNSSNLSHISISSNVYNMDLESSESTFPSAKTKDHKTFWSDFSNTSSLLFPVNDYTNNSVSTGNYTDDSIDVSNTSNSYDSCDITMSTGYTTSIPTDTYDNISVESFEDDADLGYEEFEYDDDGNEMNYIANSLLLLKSNSFIPAY
jgi:hypothetical protein